MKLDVVLGLQWGDEGKGKIVDVLAGRYPTEAILEMKAGDTVNTMTIGWGKIGIEWNKPVFIAYVRETRFTKQLLEENGEFTVNVPMGEYDPKILGYCGTKSGRDMDKIAEFIYLCATDFENSAEKIREGVTEICRRHPLYE